ncbi:MAG: sel1 repeat family protein [Chlamydiales bacterium]|nr:sel1 repeat family protein [Chlamydiales bacterium]
MKEENPLPKQELPDEQLETEAERLLAGEESFDSTAETLCWSASILFRYGIKKEKGRPLLMALNKLIQAEEANPLIFEVDPAWHHLWGNILVHLSRIVYDYSFVEKALEQYAKAAKVKGGNGGLYWDWAQAWTLLGAQSAERADLKQGLDHFKKAADFGCDSPLFRIDRAISYMICGSFTGDPSFFGEALSLLQGAIADTYHPESETTLTHARAWTTYAAACKQRYYLTHLQKDLEAADAAVREAILSVPSQADLWLEWGELYLYAGWLRRDLKLVESGIDKLTSSKVKEGDPLRLSLLLGKGLVILGLFLDDLKLMNEGKERLSAALEIAPNHGELLSAAALAELAQGMYFSSTTDYAFAARRFEEGIERDATSIHIWHGLFQTYLSWGLYEDDASLVHKGVEAITRLCQLRPYSPIHLNEWGICLLQLKQLEQDLDRQQALVEEAILRFKQAYDLQEDPETLYHWGCALDHLGDLSGDEEDYEKAIELLSRAHEANSQEAHVRYHLALALSHLGELTGNAESLFQSVELFEPLAETDVEDSTLWSDLGYALLNLSELVSDPIHPEKGEGLRREAEKRLLHAAEKGNGDANYHLACLYSLAGLVEASIHYLKRAESADALPPEGDLVHDEWLANVRETDLFKEFVYGR